MATISTLAVNLIARTSAFEKGMKRGRNATQMLRASIGKAVGAVTRFAKVLVFAGVGAMTVMIKRSLQTLDVVSKLSRRIGIATEELLALRHAAELAGVSNQALDKSLEIFVRRMGEVKSGSGEATRGLEALGLAAEKMISVTPEKAMLIIADRIQELGTQAEKSAAAYFLFGRSGAQLLNLFEKGSKGIKESTDRARRLKLTLEGFDLTKVEDANDAMLEFKSAISAVFLELTVKLSPALKNLAELMTKNRDAILQTAKNATLFSVKLLASIAAIKAVIGVIRILIAAFSLLNTKQAVTLALAGPVGWATLAAGIVVATTAVILLNKTIDNTIEGLKNIAAASDKLKKVETFKDPKTIGDLQKRIALINRAIQIEKELGITRPFDLIASFKKELKLRQDQLDILLKEKKAQESLAAAEKKRLTQLSSLMERVKAEATNIVTNVFGKLTDLSKPEKDTDGGRFQQIRSAFIDVAALNPSVTPVTELQKLNNKTDDSNRLLEELNRNQMGVFQS